MKNHIESVSKIILNRRRLLRRTALVAVGANLPGRILASETYGFRHGDFEVNVLSDGEMIVPGSFIAQDASPSQLSEALAGPDGDNSMVHLKTNIPLIRHGSDLILVDVGAGDKFQPTEGCLLSTLRANNIDRDSITKVILTHAHPDHLWGMLDSEQSLNFPNASYYVGTIEWHFWMARDVATRLPQDFRNVVAETQRSLDAIKDRMTLVNSGDQIVSGMRVIDTPGHTPGHFSLELDGGEGLIITADAVSHGVISFQYPTWHNGFDFDSEAAIRTRKVLLDRTSRDKTKLLIYHLPYPGVGYAEASDGAFRFLPAS
jgi:glyoxylase-like metal-dependent hydrolase (beta-lactamase superfamily II)